MKTARFRPLDVSLLLLTFAAVDLACGTKNHNPELRPNVCGVNLFSPNHGESLCPLGVPILSFRENASASRDQVPLAFSEEDIEDEQTQSDSPLYTIIPLPNKGLGLQALVPIPRGTQIIIEAPLLTIPMPEPIPGLGISLPALLSTLQSAFSSLPPSSQKIFLSLHNHRFPGDSSATPPNPDILTIFRSNAYNTGTTPESIGLFPLIARINHSCRPNAVNYWSEKLGERVIYAGRDIEIGEEITVSYIPLLKSTKERQARLSQYGFVCACAACTGEDGGKKRVKIADLMDVLEQKVQLASEKKVVNERLVKRAESLVGLLKEEGLVDYLARAYRFVAIFEKRAGNVEGARRWVEKEIEELKLAEEGSDEIERAREFLYALK